MIRRARTMELDERFHQEEPEAGTMSTSFTGPAARDCNERTQDEHVKKQSDLDRRTVRRLDTILLPFLALLFLLNSLDKSNIGNAESAGFTDDAGLSENDLNYALAAFFAVFVALQPVGAALGRKYGMARYVPICMSLWGLSTVLHIFVKKRWQLILLRIAIAALESGFYPTTVSYLSLFYTRFEFGMRLGVFYGQAAVAGVLGSLLSWTVFSHFPGTGGGPHPGGPGTATLESRADSDAGWKSWEVLFLVEGCLTMTVALIGFFWLPHSAETAWFLGPSEKMWAEERIRIDRENPRLTGKLDDNGIDEEEVDEDERPSERNEEESSEAHDRLLSSDHDTEAAKLRRKRSAMSLTADAGLSRHDILSAFSNHKIWHLLACNILSAIPATAFGIFLPLVIKKLSPALSLSPASSNLLSAPPFACGAIALYLFTRWSDRTQQRLVPILWSLGLLLIGLILTVMAPPAHYVLKYIALCILLSGSFIASPLTVAWLSDNTPEPGKRAILLGINGWGNLAGVFSALLFTPADEASAYIRPFTVTLLCVCAAFVGFIAFWVLLVRENARRDALTAPWSDADRAREHARGDVPLSQQPTLWRQLAATAARGFRKLLGGDDPSTTTRQRTGDDKMTFRYGL
nr:high-affinity nicotinic acid transporter [Quercus suber]